MKKYTLTVSENQAKIIAKACDMLARIHIGNVECVADEFMNRSNYSEISEMLRDVHETITGSRYGGPGISNPTVHPDGKTAWDVCQAIRHRLTHDCKVPANYSVYYQEPLQCGRESLPTINTTDGPDLFDTVHVNENETLYEFRKRYPFKPYEIVYLKSADSEIVKAKHSYSIASGVARLTQVEVISWPYNDDNGEVVIKIRLIPGDPTTMETVSIGKLVKGP